MIDLLSESFRNTPGKDNDNRDLEMGIQYNATSGELGLEDFHKKVKTIEGHYETLDKLLKTFKADHEASKVVTNSPAIKEIKQRMEKHVDKIRNIALHVKSELQELEKENLANTHKRGCEKGTAVDRSRTTITHFLKKKLKDTVSEFQALRQSIHQEHREVVERRYYTVTGNRAGEETVIRLIETGDSEQIFAKAIQEQKSGRGHVIDTLVEIQERHDAIRDVERKLRELHQVFTDMAILVADQGEMLDNIEAHVTSAADYVEKGTKSLYKAKSMQKKSRKWMCIAIVFLLVIIAIIVVGVLEAWKPWKSNTSA